MQPLSKDFDQLLQGSLLGVRSPARTDQQGAGWRLRSGFAGASAALLQGDELFAEDSRRLYRSDPPFYTIRIPGQPALTSCPICTTAFMAAGPTGFADELPICDMCLLEGNHDLGMLIAVGSVTRTFGAVKGATREEYSRALAELGAFARIYERFAERWGPPRLFRAPFPTA